MASDASFALGTPEWRNRHNQYADPGDAARRGLQAMLGPVAYQQQWGNKGGSGNRTSISSSVTPIQPLGDLLGQLMAPPAAPQGPQRPANLPKSQGWSPPPTTAPMMNPNNPGGGMPQPTGQGLLPMPAGFGPIPMSSGSYAPSQPQPHLGLQPGSVPGYQHQMQPQQGAQLLQMLMQMMGGMR